VASTPAHVKQVLSRIGELLALYVALFWLSPWIAETWPDANPIFVDVVSVICTAVISEFIIAFAIVRPTIHVEWRDERNPNPLVSIDVDATRLLSDQAYFQLTLIGRVGSPIGAFVLARARRSGLTLIVSFPVAPAFAVVDLSRPVSNGVGIARSVPQDNGIEVTLTHPREQASWAWVRILLQSATPSLAVTNSPFGIKVVPRASTRFGKVCAKVIKAQSSANHLTLYR
jgi:hypothetical protein